MSGPEIRNYFVILTAFVVQEDSTGAQSGNASQDGAPEQDLEAGSDSWAGLVSLGAALTSVSEIEVGSAVVWAVGPTQLSPCSLGFI